MSSVEVEFARGVEAHQRGSLAEAERVYGAILRGLPHHPGALQFLGLLRMQQGDLESALSLLRQAAAIAPRDAACQAKLGGALLESGDGLAALQAFDRAVELAPGIAALLNARSNVLMVLGRNVEAARDLARAIELEPGNFAHRNDLGDVMLQLGNAEDALRHFEEAARLDPRSPLPLSNAANALLAMQCPEAALASAQHALRQDPHFLEALHNGGCALLDLGRVDEARGYFERALAVDPQYVKSLINRGLALRLQGSYGEAAASFRRVLDLAPDRPHVLGALLLSLRWACRWDELDVLDARLRTELQEGKPAADPRELLLIEDSPPLLYAAARSFIESEFKTLEISARRAASARRSARLTVAYVSGDFHDHATAQLIAELIESHDRREFEIIGISFGPDDGSALRHRLRRAFDQFIDVRGATDPQVVDRIAAAGAQIAVDLKGLTFGNRLGVFARRCAPVQAAYLGYPGTTGAGFIDYLIADRMVIPPEQQRWYAENIVYLPDCYQVNDRRRHVSDAALTRADVGLPVDAFVFCCFNASYKLSAEIFAVWMRLLRDVAGSVLWLLDDNAEATRNLIKAAEHHGVAAHRIVFAQRAAPAQHIARYRLADLFLDTLPVCAHTIASEALWAGLPVLTCLGNAFAGRVAASLLHAAGLDELIKVSLSDYAAGAFTLATTPGRIQALRHQLSATRTTCPLFDTDRFRVHIEQAYRVMWRRHQDGEPPTGFTVAPAPRSA